jgi:hypothetical protein
MWCNFPFYYFFSQKLFLMEMPTHGLLEFDGEKSLSRDAHFIQAANQTQAAFIWSVTL